MRTKILFIVMIFLCSSLAFSYQDVKHLSLSAKGIEQLKIDCGAGYLEVAGIEGLEKIEVRAEIVIEGVSRSRVKSFIRDKVKLSLEKRGTRAVLISQIKNSSSFFFQGEKYINLTVKVPKNIDLDVDDGSGSIEIENIKGNLDIEDGSGSMNIENITGNIDIEDGSGSIDIVNATGNLKIDDGSGEMDIRDVKGNPDIKDGSGEIHVVNVSGNMTIDDGSGDIEAEDIRGEISIHDGSGSIDVIKVIGDVTLSDGSGSIYVDGVEKNVIIKRDGSGSVKIRNVKGKVIK